MKNILTPFALVLILTQSSCAQKLQQLAKDVQIKVPTQVVNQTPQLTNEEVISGLREALQVGIKNAVNKSAVLDGFLGNPEIRLPFHQMLLKCVKKPCNWA